MSEKLNQRILKRGLILLAVALAALLLDIIANLSADPQNFNGEASIYYSGRILGALHFMSIYSCIVVRILFAKNSKLIHNMLVFLSTVIIVTIVWLAVLPFIPADPGHVYRWELDLFLVKGLHLSSMSITPCVGVVMAITPLLLPMDMIVNIARLFSEDIKTGFHIFDDYIHYSRQTEKAHKDLDVLIIEDDLSCASVALKFMSKLKLSCMHAESIEKGNQIFQEHASEVRVIILDNFVRKESPDTPYKTGLQWLEHISKDHPHESRKFFVILTSGHTEKLDTENAAIDKILQKPWNPRDLAAFLRNKNVV